MNTPNVTNDPNLCAARLRDLINRIDGRWKLLILAQLHGSEVMRFSDLARAIPQASQKMLTAHLRQLERDGLIHRRVYPLVPPKVEYRLTDQGLALEPIFIAVSKLAV